MINEPDYVVIRDAPGALRSGADGVWFDLATVPRRLSVTVEWTCVTYDAVPTGRFEVRDDGAVAEVWEVRR